MYVMYVTNCKVHNQKLDLWLQIIFNIHECHIHVPKPCINNYMQLTDFTFSIPRFCLVCYDANKWETCLILCSLHIV